MYKIKINNNVVAVSNDLVKAMNSIPQLVADFVGIKDESFITYDGIKYLPWGNCAHATCTVNDETFEVWISKIKVL